MFTKPFDMAKLVMLPGYSEIHVRKTKIVQINVCFAQFYFMCSVFKILAFELTHFTIDLLFFIVTINTMNENG